MSGIYSNWQSTFAYATIKIFTNHLNPTTVCWPLARAQTQAQTLQCSACLPALLAHRPRSGTSHLVHTCTTECVCMAGHVTSAPETLMLTCCLDCSAKDNKQREEAEEEELNRIPTILLLRLLLVDMRRWNMRAGSVSISDSVSESSPSRLIEMIGMMGTGDTLPELQALLRPLLKLRCRGLKLSTYSVLGFKLAIVQSCRLTFAL